MGFISRLTKSPTATVDQQGLAPQSTYGIQEGEYNPQAPAHSYNVPMPQTVLPGEPNPNRTPQQGDPYAGMTHEQMAQQNGWGGWNVDNISNYNDVMAQANQFQAQGGATAGYRDYLQNQYNAFVDPKMAQYRQLMMSRGTPADATDASLVQSPDFQNWLRSGQLGSTPAQSQMNQWTGGSTSQSSTSSQTPTVQKDPRFDELFNMLMSRAQQPLSGLRTDPVVRAQSDAYAANEERARRNYVSDVAESAGPLANIRGEQRMAAERVGQRTGAFEAELMGRELSARRQEISEALQMMGGLLNDQQRLSLQKELTLLDNALRTTAMNNENDRFSAQLGFNYADRASYWDALRRGLL